MKKKYEKPMIEVDALTLDMPVASGCDPEAVDDANNLLGQDYFGGDGSCIFEFKESEDDKLCYYTNATMLFTS